MASNNDIIVLADLSLHGPRRPRSVLEVTGLTSGGLSILLERLETAALVTRSYGAIVDDRRGVLIELTELGRATIAEINDALARATAELEPLLEEFDDLLGALPDPAGRSSRAIVQPGFEIERVMRLGSLGNTTIATLADADYDADLTQATTAVVLCRAATPWGTRPRDLIADTGLSRNGVTQFLQQLEAAGLIQRTSGLPSDRRAVSITLTADGWRSLSTRLAHMVQHTAAAHEVLALLRSQPRS